MDPLGVLVKNRVRRTSEELILLLLLRPSFINLFIHAQVMIGEFLLKYRSNKHMRAAVKAVSVGKSTHFTGQERRFRGNAPFLFMT